MRSPGLTGKEMTSIQLSDSTTYMANGKQPPLYQAAKVGCNMQFVIFAP